jgi:hypothetical protein
MFVAYLFLGVALLGVVLLLGRWFVKAEPATLVTFVKWVGGTLAVLLVIYLIVGGRAASALWLAGAALVLARAMRAMGGLGRIRGARAKPGQSSDVETAYLRMTLDHDSGGMDGTVLQGPFAGRELSSLDLDELLALFAECTRADRSSLRLLEAFLDRGPHTDWRDRMDARDRAAAAKGGMTREEALEILGVDEDATKDDIKEAHRRLMQTNHPDHGGSTYLAAKINQAKEILLGA